MDNKELIRRLALLKANPKLAETIPQGEVLKMLSDVVASFNVLKAAIEAGKIKGEKGDSFKLTPDVDYPSLTRYDAKIEGELASLQSDYQAVIKTLEKRVAALTNGADGKDAEITDAIKQEIAEITLSLIELPDFDALVTDEITKNGEAIRNALELLSGDDRYKVEITDVQGLTDILNQLAKLKGGYGGGIGRNQVYNFIRQAVEDGTIPVTGGSVPPGGTTGQVLTKLSATDGDADWQDPTGGGVTDHGALTGLGDDDHTQYHNDARGDARYSQLGHTHDDRYYTETETNTLLAGKANTSHTHAIADVTGLQTALDGKAAALGSDDNYVTDAEKAALHSHANKALLDTYTQTEANLADAVAKKHAHANLAVLDATTASFTTADETKLDGLVSNATHTGDATGATALTLATVNSNVGSFGLAASVAQFTVNAKGLITAAANVAISITSSAVSDFAATVRATVLTGLSTATSTAVTAADTILVAIGKLQAQNTAQDSAIALNTAKVTNATHTGEVTGSGALTVDKTAITNKTLVTAAVGDHILVADASDTDNLKKVTVQTIVDLAGGGGNTFNDIYIDQSGGTSDTYGVLSGTINGSNALFTVSQAVYATGTLKVWLNGQLMTQGTGEDFVETTPASGTFTFNTAPATGSLLTVEYQKVVTNSDTIVTTTTVTELAQDATGAMAANSTFVNLTYNDGTPSLTPSLSATGTPSATTYLRGDNTWATPAGGGGVSLGLVTTLSAGFTGI